MGDNKTLRLGEYYQSRKEKLKAKILRLKDSAKKTIRLENLELEFSGFIDYRTLGEPIPSKFDFFETSMYQDYINEEIG